MDVNDLIIIKKFLDDIEPISDIFFSVGTREKFIKAYAAFETVHWDNDEVDELKRQILRKNKELSEKIKQIEALENTNKLLDKKVNELEKALKIIENRSKKHGI